MFNGFGRGSGSRGGMGFGFRGSSPPWPYVGRGRGGLPRCGYFLGGAAAAPAAAPYAKPAFAPQASREQELAFLQDQTKVIKDQLEQIENEAKALEKKYEKRLKKIHPENQKSALNLIHYLALRNKDIRDLQNTLGQLGISRLGRAESHVMASITAVKNLLNKIHQIL